MLEALLQTGVLGGRLERIPLAVGTIAMLAGMAYFLADGWDARGEAREYYAITAMVPGIASAAYLAMFFGFGLTEVEVAGRGTLDIYWARYADWLFTTPLLLLDLCLLADADRTTIGTLVGVDAFMIVTGLVGTLSKTTIERYTWWLTSTIAFAFIVYYLYQVLGATIADRSADAQSTFSALRRLTVLVWVAYPIVWIVGTEGAGVVGLFVETTLFMVLDVTAKVGFGFLLLSSRSIYGDAPTASGRPDDGTAAVGRGAAAAGGVSGDAGERGTDLEPEREPGEATIESDDAVAAAESTATSEGHSSLKIEYYEDRGGEWRWRVRSGNGRILASSGEGYASRSNVVRALDGLREYVAQADYLQLDPAGFEIYRGRDDEWRWRLRHRNGNILAASGEGFEKRSDALAAAERVRDVAPDADVAPPDADRLADEAVETVSEEPAGGESAGGESVAEGDTSDESAED